jgi:predicted lipoprotein with Yx(FWY)xxD motif
LVGPLRGGDDRPQYLDYGLPDRSNEGMKRAFLLVAAGIVLLGSGVPDAMAAAARRGPLVKLHDSQFGPVLFSGGNRALYLFTRDPRHKTRCYGDCAEAWPPLYARGRPRAGRGLDADRLATIQRRGGRRQVTYRGRALYFYVHDPKGQVLCNDVFEFGGTWFAVNANGRRPS